MSEEKFHQMLKQSQVAVAAVAAYFIRAGLDVRVDGVQFDKADEGDIWVKRPSEESWRIVEVKARWTANSDEILKFPHVFIDKKTTFDKKQHLPDFYYIVGTDKANALLFNVDDWAHTTVETFKDRCTGNIEEGYAVSPDLFKRVRLQ